MEWNNEKWSHSLKAKEDEKKLKEKNIRDAIYTHTHFHIYTLDNAAVNKYISTDFVLNTEI